LIFFRVHDGNKTPMQFYKGKTSTIEEIMVVFRPEILYKISGY